MDVTFKAIQGVTAPFLLYYILWKGIPQGHSNVKMDCLKVLEGSGRKMQFH